MGTGFFIGNNMKPSIEVLCRLLKSMDKVKPYAHDYRLPSYVAITNLEMKETDKDWVNKNINHHSDGRKRFVGEKLE